MTNASQLPDEEVLDAQSGTNPDDPIPTALTEQTQEDTGGQSSSVP